MSPTHFMSSLRLRWERRLRISGESTTGKITTIRCNPRMALAWVRHGEDFIKLNLHSPFFVSKRSENADVEVLVIPGSHLRDKRA